MKSATNTDIDWFKKKAHPTESEDLSAIFTEATLCLWKYMRISTDLVLSMKTFHRKSNFIVIEKLISPKTLK